MYVDDVIPEKASDELQAFQNGDEGNSDRETILLDDESDIN